MKKPVYLIPLVALAFPAVAFAQLGNVTDLLESIQGIVDLLIPIAIGLAFLAFIWGLAVFIFKAGDEEAKEKGRRIMIGGIIALFVILAIWGILEFIGNALGIDVGENIERIPNVPTR